MLMETFNGCPLPLVHGNLWTLALKEVYGICRGQLVALE